MRQFVIIDSTRYPVNLQLLDKKVCEFWDVKWDPDRYAAPKDSHYQYLDNWITVIGDAISNHDKYTTGWSAIIEHLVCRPIGRAFMDSDSKLKITYDGRTIRQIKRLMEYYQPYIDLINYFAELGLQPKQL